jgi:CDP-diglyceride synthetase
MKKRLSSILRSMAIGGLVASAVVRVLIQFTASPVPDPASGRTEPSLFAPAISSNWQYITQWQSLLLAVLTGAALVCFAAWLAVSWVERRTAGSRLDATSDARQFQARRIADRQGR